MIEKHIQQQVAKLLAQQRQIYHSVIEKHVQQQVAELLAQQRHTRQTSYFRQKTGTRWLSAVRVHPGDPWTTQYLWRHHTLSIYAWNKWFPPIVNTEGVIHDMTYLCLWLYMTKKIFLPMSGCQHTVRTFSPDNSVGMLAFAALSSYSQMAEKWEQN